MNQRQLTFPEAVKTCFARYLCFTGRASRSEYWWWTLFTVIICMPINLLFVEKAPAVVNIVQLALLLPSVSVGVRRLHDIGRSGWWLLIALIPIVGFIIVMVWAARKSQSITNEYGPVPNIIQ